MQSSALCGRSADARASWRVSALDLAAGAAGGAWNHLGTIENHSLRTHTYEANSQFKAQAKGLLRVCEGAGARYAPISLALSKVLAHQKSGRAG